MLSRNQLESLLAAFEQVDRDGKGTIPASAVDACIKHAGLSTTAEQDAALLLLQVDAEAGLVSYGRLKSEASLAIAGAGSVESQQIANIPQPDLVFKLMRELRELFNKFDVGSLSLHGLRQDLAKLGICETQACLELFRHPYEMTFNQFVQALARVDRTSAPSEPKRTEAKSSVSEKHAGLTAKRSAHENKISNIFEASMTEQGFETFRTTAQQYGSPLLSKSVPLTSAGYDTRDKGVLRHQVHAAIRKLDAGEFDEKMFTRNLDALGISLPIEAQGLLEKVRLGSRVTFKEWLKAFESFFDSATHFEANQPRETKTEHLIFSDLPKGKIANAPRPLRASIFEDSKPRETVTTKKHWSNHILQSTISLGEIENEKGAVAGNVADAGFKTSSSRRGRVSSPVKQDFMRWMYDGAECEPDGETTARPVRAQMAPRSDPNPPFARELEINMTGVKNLGQRKNQARTPFGTEADYAASFANGVAPKLEEKSGL